MGKDTTDYYDALAIHFDSAAIGAPDTPELRQIIAFLFSPQEAQLAATAPFVPQPAAKLAIAAGMEPDEALPILEAMADKGLMYQRKTKKAQYFSLLPLMPGIAEMQFMGGEVNEQKRHLAHLFEAYYEPGFAPALHQASQVSRPYSRVIPVGRTVEGKQEILPYEQAEKVLEDASAIAVTNCYCRQEAEIRGEGCSAPKEVCLMFGPFARFVSEKGLARLVDLEEAKKILEKAEDAGLVHVTDNVAQGANFMCNCCGCCCMFLRSITKLNLVGTVAQAGFVAEVDPESCTSCEGCLDACQVGAISMEEDKPAMVDPHLCLGCGQCQTVCAMDAIEMQRRQTKPPAKNFGELAQGISQGRKDAAAAVS